jgi:amino acid adenylation domain-containing protein
MPEQFSRLEREQKKRALLAMRERISGTPAPGAPSSPLPVWISGGNSAEPFPLTELQSSHFVSKCMPESDPVGCHTYMEFLVPNLDVRRLELAWNQLLRIHPMLNACIHRNGTQSTPPPEHYSIRSYEASSSSEAASHIDALRAEMSHRVYKAGDFPLYDIRVTHVPGSPSRVHVSMDTWIADGASASTLYRQWRLLYESPGASLQPPAASFSEFVQSMKAFERSDQYRQCLDYWINKLRDLPGGPRLPYCAAKQSASGATAHLRRRWKWVCKPEEWKAIQETAARAGISSSIALLGVFVQHLRSFCCDERFSLVLTHYNRPNIHPEIRQVVGPFSGTSILILEPHPDQPLDEQLRDYQRQMWSDLDNSYAGPLSAVRAKPQAVHFPPIPVVFTSTIESADLSMEGASWLDDVDYGVSQTPGVDLHFQASQRKDGLHIVWDVAHERFEPGVIQLMFEDFCSGVSQLCDTVMAESSASLFRNRAGERKRALIQSAKEDNGEIPLTLLQQGYLARQRTYTGEHPSCVYREFEITEFQAGPLQTAVAQMLQSSPMLRSLLCTEQLRFMEHPAAGYPVPMDDIRELDDEQIAAHCQKVRSEMQESLAAARGWPGFSLRVSLLAGLTARLHVLLEMVVFDGFSVWLFYDELFQRYTQANYARSGDENYPAYARARESYRGTPAYAADQVYWAQKFEAGVSRPQSHWPSTGIAGSCRYSVQFDQWQLLKNAAMQRHIPPTALLSGLFAEALRRSSGWETLSIVVVGSSQRSLLPEMERAYGDLSSLAWIRHQNTTETVEEILRRIADTLSRDWQHDWGNPFISLRKLLAGHGPRSSFTAALTDCLGAPLHSYSGIRELYAAAWTSGADIDQMVIEQNGILHAFWQVDRGSVPEAASALIRDQYQRMLESLCASPEAWHGPLADLGTRKATAAAASLGSRIDSAPRMHTLNQTDAEYDRTQCVHHLVEKQASTHPGRIALISNDSSLTYGQFDRHANQLAHFLRRSGISRGDRVGVLLERSFDSIIALIAILKAGAAYVPLSLSEPPFRTTSMLRQAGVKTIVTTSRHAGLLGPSQSLTLLDLERQRIEAENGGSPPACSLTSEDTAYIIFTSGSTGEPKGVTVCHRPVINLIEWAKKTFEFNEADRVLFVNSFGFDLSVFDVFGVLACGGSVRIASDQERLDASLLSRILLHEQITFWDSAPAYLQFVMPSLKAQAAGADQRGSLRICFLSGDWIPLQLPGELRDVFPDARVIGLGGATEATVWSNYFEIGSIDPEWKSIPYGRPIQNARYYILNEDLAPCPDGTRGHLYIGGECLSSGYSNAPDLTASRFVPDPFHEKTGMVMYRTGDMARVAAPGQIEFLGRLDSQIKIRGFRIELGEIEAALARCGISSPVAVLRENTPKNLRIVGFGIVPSTHGAVHDQHLWRKLEEFLPDYMMPSEIYALPSIPITASGKIDRQRLAGAAIADLLQSQISPGAPAISKPELAAQVRPSQPVVEQFLCATLAHILAINADTVTVTSDFGALGVNSLHFAFLTEKLTERSGVPVSPAKLFHCASIADIIETLGQRSPEALAAIDGPAPAPARAASAEERAEEISNVSTKPPREEPPAVFELAIIGAYCRMPEADGMDEFWNNLITGKDCITAVPKERWNWRSYYGDPDTEENVCKANRAGFISDVDKFDAAFFGISPREAEFMDPRQRLMLQATWKALEDAGYRPSELRKRNIGIYIGVTGDEYASLMREAGCTVDQFSLIGSARSLVANRISYYFGWHGPSEVVDTTCSSSLVALHNAFRAVQHGDCEMAIVAGINILIDPFPHLSLGKVGVLSADSKCKTFDAAANGYVRGEGIGVIVVKPLQQAQADHDNIHAVVSGTAVGHGGRASGLTVPNARAQARVIVNSFRQAGIHPDRLGYIEAHGTGTSLGDPIEIEGIKEALLELYGSPGQSLPQDKRICIGSVKTCIGHLESAAGISGVLKVLLMLRHRVLPPVVHLKTINSRIELGNTPLFFTSTALPWAAPLSDRGALPARVSGISSFGLGGVNAHCVVREYVEESQRGKGAPDHRPTVVPLSAPSAKQLAEYIERLIDFFEKHRSSLRFEDVAFTLRVGREAFSERVAIISDSLEHLIAQLRAIVNRRGTPYGTWYGDIRTEHNNASMQSGGATDGLAATSAPEVVAQAWASGMNVDWIKFYSGHLPRRISLPTLCFLRTSYWPDVLRDFSARPRVPRLVESEGPEGRAFHVRLTGEEAFVKDHQIQGTCVTPAAAFIAFAAAAGQRFTASAPGSQVGMRNIVWPRFLGFAEGLPQRLQLTMTEHNDSVRLAFQDANNPQIEYCSTIVDSSAGARPPARDVERIKKQSATHYSSEACYKRFTECGISYGPSLQVIREVWRGETQAIAHIVQQDQFGEPWSGPSPTITDGAFQTAVLHQLLAEARSAPHVPFTVRRIAVYASLPSECYAHAVLKRKNIGPKALHSYDLTLLGLDGSVLVELEGCMGVPLESATPKSPQTQWRIYREDWQPCNVKDDGTLDNATVFHLTVGAPKLADALLHAGQRVLANVLTANGNTDQPGSAIPWDSFLEQLLSTPSPTVVLSYDHSALCSLPPDEHLRFGFDTVFELTKRLAAQKKIKHCTVVLYLASFTSERLPVMEALTGFARVAEQEHPKIRFKLVQSPELERETAETLCDQCLHRVRTVLASDANSIEHRFTPSGLHEVRCLKGEEDQSRAQALPITPGGVYLISGGAGAIGRSLRDFIAERGGKVAAIGRSRPGADWRSPSAAGQVEFFQADVTDPSAVKKVLADVRMGLGRIHGIFHCAGEARGRLLSFKSLNEARTVISAKTIGTLVLDEATRDEPIEWFVLFSSLASMTGPVGGSDYAYANRFADLYAAYRNSLAERGLRSGRSLAVSWPLWESGNLHPPQQEVDFLRSRGLESIQTGEAILALATCMSKTSAHCICAHGQPSKFEKYLLSMYPGITPSTEDLKNSNKATAVTHA